MSLRCDIRLSVEDWSLLDNYLLHRKCYDIAACARPLSSIQYMILNYSRNEDFLV